MQAVAWQPEKTDEDGMRSQVILLWGAPAGIVLQFPSNAPTTYAEAFGSRLGAIESWEAARAHVESAVAAKQK